MQSLGRWSWNEKLPSSCTQEIFFLAMAVVDLVVKFLSGVATYSIWRSWSTEQECCTQQKCCPYEDVPGRKKSEKAPTTKADLIIVLTGLL